MRKTAGQIVFAPTDLARFMENPYVAWMDRLHLEFPDSATPDDDSDEQKIIADLGLQHERAFLAKLQSDGRDILQIPVGSMRERLRATETAMAAGQEVIYQAALTHVPLSGFADFLFRVEIPSKLGDYSYEAWDAKLAKTARPYSLVQLCCYADLLQSIQATRPQRMVIVAGDGKTLNFRTDDYFYYYLEIKKAFLEQQGAFDVNKRPDPLQEGKNGKWETAAARWLTQVDHLSRVAGIRADQIKKLRLANVGTLQELAALPGETKVPRMRTETFAKLQRQADMQLRSAGRDHPEYAVLPMDPADPRRGVALLPAASPLDVAFDIEGYPLVEGGLEYLLGATTLEDNELHFNDWWAHDDDQEKRSFEAFIDWVLLRWKSDPSMHVYHYAAYEVTAMRRLMGKYGTRENAVDELLRNEVFVDLYTIVRQGLCIGTPSYSLKKVESLYLPPRQEDVATAGDSIVAYQRWIDSPDGDDWRNSEILRQIRDYNKVDCDSTWKLIEWLRQAQTASGISYLPPPRADDKKADDAPESESSLLARELLDAIPEDRSDDPEKWRVQELLAHVLEFHWREAKPTWWRMFDRRDMTEDELRDDLDCLAGLTRTTTPPRDEKRSVAFEFRYDPRQDTKIRWDGKKEKRCYFAHDLTRCSILSMDAEHGSITLKIGPKALEQLEPNGVPHRLSLIPDDHVSGDVIAKSILRVASQYRDNGHLPAALEDFLRRRRPRLPSRPQDLFAANPLAHSDETPFDTAMAIVPEMAQTTLCIQGPPGTGKTYTGAHVILALLAAGKRVGVTTNSHKAIGNLLMRVSEEAKEKGQTLKAVKVGGDDEDPLLDCPGFSWVQNATALCRGSTMPQLIGGTAWTFSHEGLLGQLDYLFVDEAGQVSVANLVGMSPSAKNLVLLGDQMQLSQPLQGSHPGESGLSCLDYLLQEHATIPEQLGIFLSTTWRMHPDVCRFISGVVYEDRLTAAAHTAHRRILSPADSCIDRESGILFVPVEHEANRQGSIEEVEAVQGLVDELLRSHHTDKKGQDIGLLQQQDILIVAPYNLQVRLLKEALGDDFRVGTIDKFQGQEAPVVIISMAASSGEESPRGLEFLFDTNRLNVAISRAQSLAILVGHPSLASTPCRTVAQMQLVNLFARAVSTQDQLRPMPRASVT